MVQGKSTVVSIVLDASGSMTTHKMDVARDVMRVLLEALHDLKIPTGHLPFLQDEAPQKQETITLKAICGSGGKGEPPVLTVMLPCED